MKIGILKQKPFAIFRILLVFISIFILLPPLSSFPDVTILVIRVSVVYLRPPKAYVILAADFDSPASISNYGILTPLTAFIWSRVFNVTPVVILGSKEPGRITTVIEEAFYRLVYRAGGRLHCISRGVSKGVSSSFSMDAELIGATLITALQVSRIASLSLQYFNENDTIFTSDADIWPMSNYFWHDYLSRSLNQENEDFFVYDKRFYFDQKEAQDCNFLAVTIGFGSKTRIWRKILSFWLDSLNYTSTPRKTFCEYPNKTDSSPILPWYTDLERKIHTDYIKEGNNLNGHNVLFPNLLRLFLEEGRKAYGDVWDREILYIGEKYKERSIWNYDQVLMTEMILAARPKLRINIDLRRFDKFGTRDSESAYASTVLGKSVEDFTDAHLDGVTDNNWWRLELIWLLVFKDKNPTALSEAIDFFRDVRSVYDVIKSNTDEITRGNLLFHEEMDTYDSKGICNEAG